MKFYRRFIASRIDNKRRSPMRMLSSVVSMVLGFIVFFGGQEEGLRAIAQSSGEGAPIVQITINGPISPATDDFLRTSLSQAVAADAKLLLIRLNTPGGVLTSMQTMVEQILESPIPIVVYVSPAGGGAISAGVFITMAAHVAVMAPGTTIGAAHPVLGGGQDVQGDMRAKIENFSASLIKAIAEQRGRNTQWAEKAVRESVAITDKEAQAEGVIDFVASDTERLLKELEGRTVTVRGNPLTIQGTSGAPIRTLEMSFKQQIVAVLADPNIAVLLGLGAMLGIGLELFHPGGIIPGVVGVICLILSLVAGQVLPISFGGLALLVLGAVFFVVELFMPAFGVWGIAGIVCLVLGSIYFVDTDLVWSANGLEINKLLIGGIAAVVGALLLLVSFLALRSQKSAVTTGKEGLVGRSALVKQDFVNQGGEPRGVVEVMGEIWRATIDSASDLPTAGQRVVVKSLEPGMLLRVERSEEPSEVA